MIQEVRAGAVFVETLGCENLMCLYVFVKIDVEILTKPMVLEGCRHARAVDARMWSAWYYLMGIRANRSS